MPSAASARLSRCRWRAWSVEGVFIGSSNVLKFQSGGTFQNYYMYHGGTNFGCTSGGPYITASYDFEVPLDEYGNLRQPKWGHLKDLLHIAIKMMKNALLQGVVNNTDLGNGVAGMCLLCLHGL